ncbi:hypothetical protein L917_12570 [Phytophthora nicotianae]|uniref:Retrotransposon Copia-like N-terminal domain-containing protein n=1 Tax=Phytophthora nicotianae TaxID=4792 RepID=W2KVE6_PHYNI|nr:hypothetical protein L915_18017 [Phytophthora nicotianae]ETL88350.1 hypothetical protein L917_12570 [Phytophthora nicotianae]
MSPTQASIENDHDFSRLNGRNFIIWKTRVTAALEGKNLLGFVTRADYAEDSDAEFSNDDDLDPALFYENQASEPSESNSAASGADGDVEMTQANLSVVKALAPTKQDERKRVEKLKAKRHKPSSRALCLMEAKAKAFLITNHRRPTCAHGQG